MRTGASLRWANAHISDFSGVFLSLHKQCNGSYFTNTHSQGNYSCFTLAKEAESASTAFVLVLGEKIKLWLKVLKSNQTLKGELHIWLPSLLELISMNHNCLLKRYINRRKNIYGSVPWKSTVWRLCSTGEDMLLSWVFNKHQWKLTARAGKLPLPCVFPGCRCTRFCHHRSQPMLSLGTSANDLKSPLSVRKAMQVW